MPATWMTPTSGNEMTPRSEMRASQYYVYGQVQRPGMYPLDRGMTVAQAIAKGGGLTLRGTDKGVRVHRRYGNNTVQVLEPKLDDPIRPGDLIFVRESVF